jgi:hypothetical protein
VIDTIVLVVSSFDMGLQQGRAAVQEAVLETWQTIAPSSREVTLFSKKKRKCRKKKKKREKRENPLQLAVGSADGFE